MSSLSFGAIVARHTAGRRLAELILEEQAKLALPKPGRPN